MQDSGKPKIDIPENFQKNIKETFGEKGKNWLQKSPDILSKCFEKWDLSHWELGNDLSYNLIFFAQSSVYGEVVLKIGIPHPDLFSEMEAISLYKGDNICKCYDKDENLGAMLLEKINPGYNLTHLQEEEKKIEIGSELIKNLPTPLAGDHNLPTYEEWINRAFEKAREGNIIGERMRSYLNIAEIYYEKLEKECQNKVLLHGDLHHFNILKEGKDKLKIIDPKGVIGFPIQEAPRFMENQLNMVPESQKSGYLQKMINIFSDKFEFFPEITARALFIDYVLSTCWSFENQIESEKLKERLKGNIEDCQMILEYIRYIE